MKVFGQIIREVTEKSENKLPIIWEWGEALDTSEWIVLDAGVFLYTCATHSENFSSTIRLRAQ